MIYCFKFVTSLSANIGRSPGASFVFANNSEKNKRKGRCIRRFRKQRL